MNQSDESDFRLAFEARNLELELYWRRSNYFLVLNTVVALAYFNDKVHAVPQWMICGLGLIFSVLWFLVLCGGKFWQTRWEGKLRSMERERTLNRRLFDVTRSTVRQEVRSVIEEDDHSIARWPIDFLTLHKPSVTLVMMFLSIVFVATWIALFFVDPVTAQEQSVQAIANAQSSVGESIASATTLAQRDSLVTGLAGVGAALIAAIVAMWSVRRSWRDQKISVVHREMLECMIQTLSLFRRSHLMVDAVAKQTVYRDRVSQKVTGTAFDRFASGQGEVSREYAALMPRHELLFPQDAFQVTKETLDKINDAAWLAYRKNPQKSGVYPATDDLDKRVTELARAYDDCVAVYRSYAGTGKLKAFESVKRRPIETEERVGESGVTSI